MNKSFENLGSFETLYESQNAETEKKNDALDEKEDQIDRIITQLKSDRKDLKKRLDRSYLNANEDSAGLLMDLEVIEKRLELNKTLREKLFGNEAG
jgi:chromosome segregation ATPase